MAFISVHYLLPNTISQFPWACGEVDVDGVVSFCTSNGYKKSLHMLKKFGSSFLSYLHVFRHGGAGVKKRWQLP